MSNPSLSSPGSSAYSSNTMYVGDGTWDSQRNTFLLPNLQGLNLATTQYNGMGNRFRNMVGYRGLIKGHGILAVITFLVIVPAAIFLARFYHRNPQMALRFHIWLQMLTVLLSTAVFILGFQAVGLARSLTNPHHGIGVAIYTMILLQALGGCVIHRVEKNKERYKVPLKLMLHQWIGRLIAVLGIVQVALGLTLYGSPKILFILYAVWGFLLLVAWFILSYITQPSLSFDDRGTYISERTETTRRSRSHRGGLGALATAGAAGAGLAALRRRSRSRSASRRRPSGGRQEVLSSHPGSHLTESYADEKYTEDGRTGRTWRERLLGAGAAAGGIFALRSLFNRKKHATTETGSDVSYSRPIGQSEVTQTDLSRVEEGRAPTSPGRDHWRRVEEREAAQAAAMGPSPLRQAHRPARSGGSMDSSDSRTSISEEYASTRPKAHGLRDGVAALGVIGFLKHSWNRRRNKREDEHVEALKQQDLEEERIARKNSTRRKYTGDGIPPRGTRPPSTIFSESDISGMTPAPSRPNMVAPPPRSTTNLAHSETIAGPSIIPVAGPDTHGILSDSGSEAYVSGGGSRHRRHRTGTAGSGALAAGAATAAATSTGSPSRRDRSQRRGSRDGSVNSPPVSVKVKMHNDGRHVTLRRLNEQEAAAEREARRKERQKGRSGSMSSLGDSENRARWRRNEAMEAAQAQEMAQSQAPLRMPEPGLPPPPPGPPPVGASSSGQHIPLPPPPPIPAAGGSILSSPSGQAYGTETDVSNFDSNRRRRRAERAQAKAAKGGKSVDFS
ncbi:hypothetical protein CC80DRAFT_468098 [Byssothecium circinans]|uniref:Cytochrome b561 domain-containing protein n=1 Tax=Byssothecium circinans TaxID=147558 RepID=A0A6A5U1M2_9PLEO|nr:hypothetical protein CC80DRAFT_468098 [Byssothecium circinans]